MLHVKMSPLAWLMKNELTAAAGRSGSLCTGGSGQRWGTERRQAGWSMQEGFNLPSLCSPHLNTYR